MDAVISRVRAVRQRVPAAASATARWWAHSRPHASGRRCTSRTTRAPLNPRVRAVGRRASSAPSVPPLFRDRRDRRPAGSSRIPARATSRAERMAGRTRRRPRRRRRRVSAASCRAGVAATPPGVKNTDGREEAARAIPRGFATTEPRRVTLMIAFWKSVGSRYGDARDGRERDASAWVVPRLARRFPTHVRSWRTIPRCVARRLVAARLRRRRSVFAQARKERTPSPPRRVPAAPAAAVWEDVDAERNASCFPSLSVNALRSLPARDACFMFQYGSGATLVARASFSGKARA